MSEPSMSCRVCDEAATHRVGTYVLCSRHFELATRERPHVWRTQAVAIAILVGLVVVASLLSALEGSALNGLALLVVGLVIAVVPAAVWLTLFYREDRVEPEPRHLVVGVAVLGGLLAAAVGVPFLDDVLQPGRWAGSNVLVQLAANILGVGLVPAALVYAAVRFSVYGSGEFDEATDGVIYGTAAGLGYATYQNVGVILDAGGASLTFGSIFVVLTALTLAGTGGLVGWFMSGQKLRGKPAWWTAAGVALGAVVLGLYTSIRAMVIGSMVSVAGFLVGPWIGLVLAILLAGGVSYLLTRTIRRDIVAATAQEVAS